MRIKLRICTFLVLVLLLTLAESRRGGGGRGGGGRSGGGWGSRGGSSSSRSGSSSWFGSRSSSSRSSSSSGSRSGSWASGGSRSSSYPKQQYGSGGSRSSSRTPIGGGGFVNPKATSYGSAFGSKNTYNYKSPGYGTKFGTSFPGGVGKYGGKGFSKKALGLGVGAGFIGGAALGVAGTAATMGVYHRYMQYRFLTGGWGYNPYYYNHYYYGNNCWGGCPWNAHCEWSFCECNRGYVKKWGHCQREDENVAPRPRDFDPFKPCEKNETCLEIDVNLICNTNLTIQNVGKCECRENMRWNTEAGECQLYLDVDCSSITYESKPSTIVLAAVNKTLDSLEGKNTTEINLSDPSKPENQTISASPNATLTNSLLSSIDKDKASKDEIKEAFCRDIDSFSWEFGQPKRERQISSGTRTVGSIVGIIIGVIAISALCCVCCFCCICKGAFDKIKKSFKSDKSYDQNGGGMTFSNVQQTAGEATYPQSYPPQPQGYHNEPPAIPPTQPGYSNYPPEYNNTGSQYPPQYPPTNQAPYPPMTQPMYPPVNQPPFNPGPNY